MQPYFSLAPPELPPGAERGIRSLSAALHTLLREKPSMTVAAARVFLAVCLREGSSLKELCEATGMAQSTVSRVLLDLGERTRTGAPGAGLVQWGLVPTEIRRKDYRLTSRGQAVRDRILAALKGGRPDEC